MEVSGNDVHITRKELLEVASDDWIRNAANRGKIKSERRGVYSYNSLPDEKKQLFRRYLCDGLEPRVWIELQDQKKEHERKKAIPGELAGLVVNDENEVSELFGMGLEDRLVFGYARLCGWLRVCLNTSSRTVRELQYADKMAFFGAVLKEMGREWEAGRLAGQKIKAIRPLQNKCKAYKDEGVQAVVNRKVGVRNENARKVDARTERLLLVLCTRVLQDNQTYAVEVWRNYMSFLAGNLRVVDKETGEVFEPSEFEPVGLTTVQNLLKRNQNAAQIAKLTKGALEYRSKKGYVSRRPAMYSLSKCTMDDQDVPYKLKDGRRVFVYWIFDVKSGAVIGYSIGLDKNVDLYKAAIVNLMLNPMLGGRMPLEVEVEQHISSNLKESVLKKGEVFANIRWCLGGNPQEKAAEKFIKRMRYDFQRMREGFLYRPFAKQGANRSNKDLKVQAYSFGEIKAFIEADVEAYNNSPHVREKGKTRLEVLAENVNPNALAVDWVRSVKQVGLKVDRVVHNNMYLIIDSEKYMFLDSDMVKRLKSYRVEVYYIREMLEQKVWVWQDGDFLGEAMPVPRVNEASVEWTEQDAENFKIQTDYIKKFEGEIKTVAADIKRFEVQKIEPVVREDVPKMLPKTQPSVQKKPLENAENDIYDDENFWKNL